MGTEVILLGKNLFFTPNLLWLKVIRLAVRSVRETVKLRCQSWTFKGFGNEFNEFSKA